MLQLESKQVTVTETTEEVTTTGTMICPLKKPLPHPQNYLLSLRCTHLVTDCGYATICMEGESVWNVYDGKLRLLNGAEQQRLKT